MPALYPRLWRFALMQAGDRQMASDLAQATCLRALEKADGFTPGTRLDSWLFKMAHRLWLNEIRAQAVRRGGGLMPVESLDLPDPAPTPETNIFTTEVLSFIYGLPEAQRAAVLLVYCDGYSYAEAAEILEVPIGTIMSRLSSARRKVADAMGKESMEQAHG